jgi:flagellar biosynthetic protein FliQ
MVLGQEALVVIVKLSAPILLATLLVGLAIALVQAATQINEATLTFVPKLIVAGGVMIFAGPWMMRVMMDYIHSLVRSIPQLVG